MTEADDIDVQIASIVSGRSLRGMVELTINGRALKMDLAKAREIRGMLDGAIEAAVSDELMVAFLVKRIGLPPEKAAQALLDFREMRQGSKGTVYPS